MRFVADEGVDRPIVSRLREVGHQVDYIAELAPSLSDDEVLAMANRLEAVLITQDKDFGELVYRQQRASNGILLIRLAGQSPDTKATLASFVVSAHGEELTGAFAVLSSTGLRIRKLGSS